MTQAPVSVGTSICRAAQARALAAVMFFDKKYPKAFCRTMRVLFGLIATLLYFRKKFLPRRAILYVGHCYYYPWYLSRGLRPFGWKADVLNWDPNPASQIYYHGEDFKFCYESEEHVYEQFFFYLKSLFQYDIFHFSNAHAIVFGYTLNAWFKERFGEFFEIFLLKRCGKLITYTNNACLDGVSQTAFSKWAPESVCSICSWKNVPAVCSDERNLAWGRFRNTVTDYQCTLGGNRVDFNDAPTVHEVPEVYCLDSNFWNPDIDIPESFLLKRGSQSTVWLYHGVGNKKLRTSESGVNIHTSHIYFPLIEGLKQEGFELEVLSPTEIPNKDLRFMQVQSDIFLDMLTYGWFGAMAREAMMLGKPVICYLRPEWLASMKQEIPEYVAELPVINATPATVEGVLRELIGSPDLRREIGLRSRAFALKWHSSEAAGQRFDQIYGKLLKGDPLLRMPVTAEVARG